MELFLFFFVSFVVSQQVGTQSAEKHPSLPTEECTSSGCNTLQTSIVLDANWRWAHTTSGSSNCYTGNTWDKSLCPDPQTCASNCAIDGADYTGTYGINTQGNSIELKFVTKGPYSTNIGSRVYLMDSESSYKIFHLKGKEFTFDVDVSNLPCGLNGALYFVEMSADGGLSKYPGNKAGAKYGTGYCDAQCPHDIKWLNGEANSEDWVPSPTDPNSGTGKYGSCCVEMDIWEANSASNAYTPHPCTVRGQTRCSGNDCGDGSNRYGGVCDKDGCDFNPYRMGNTSFFGPSSIVNTKQPFTVVTQFPTNSSGHIKEIRRLYVQNGKVIQNSASHFSGITPSNSVSDAFCAQQKTLFGDKNDFAVKGGLPAMEAAFDRGLVLVMSLWDDHTADMLWLDSAYPSDKPATAPGVARGACATTSGVPKDVESNYPNSSVKYSNIRTGDIGTTYRSK